jgi:O-methyltransferase
MKKTTFLKLCGDKFNYILNSFGYTATFSFKGTENPMYETVTTIPTYAPWNVDKDFKEIYSMIQKKTFVDKYRCYELWQLVGEITKVPGALIEVGVWRGGSGALIGKRAELCGIKDTVYLCDTFEGIVKVDSTKDSVYKNGVHSDTSIKIVENLVIKKMKLKNVKILKGIFPDETNHFVKDKKFRFCHIDVDVYHSAKDIVNWIWDKMSAGGIIVYDDYGNEQCEGITKMVEEERKKTDRLIIHNLNGHAVEIKLS